MNKIIVILVVVFSMTACQAGNNLGTTEKGALTGGALGAGLGAIVGSATGNAGAGTAIGAASGLLVGGAVGSGLNQREQQLSQRERTLAEQERILAENRRLIEELRGRGLDVRDTARGVAVNLPDVLFEFGKSNLTSEARNTTRNISDVLRSVSGRDVYVEGHTDSVGSDEFNQRLSERRALAVADQLSASGVAKQSIFVRGFGKREPIASNATSSGRQRNRRVEVIIGN